MNKLVKCITGAVLAVCMVTTGMPGLGLLSQTAQAAADTNLALNKTATANDVESGTSFTADKAVDGNSSTRWATNADNAGTAPKWLQVDFGTTTTFDTVDISWEQQNIVEYKLEVSDNAESWTTVFERNSNPTTKDESISLEAPAVGRYLRVYVSRYDQADWKSVSIFELAVYNSKDDTPDVSGGNYTIYPTPQKVTDEEGTITLTDTINVIQGEGIDTVTAKLLLIERCRAAGVPVLSSMGAANKLDPTAFRVADIEQTSVDPLARIVRVQCRKRGIRGLKVVFSTEPPLPPLPDPDGEPPAAPDKPRRSVPASNAFVPAACGLVMGGEAVKDILRAAGALRRD